MMIEFRKRIEVNTDPLRRCYWGVHAKSEVRWTEWSVLEEHIKEERAEERLEFWRNLNEYAVRERGPMARQEFRIKP